MDPTGSTLNELFDIVERAVTPETRFASARVRHLHGWWQAARGNDIPWRHQFDIVDHREIIEHIFVIDCLPTGDFVFRLSGEEVYRLIGRNNSGELVKRGAVGEYGTALFDYYSSIVAERCCKHSIGSLKDASRESRRFEGIDCPLTEDGHTVSRIIGVMELID
jgi:hypothetical protein